MKYLNKIVAIFCTALLVSCQAGLEYEEVPESVYNNVDLTSNYCNVQARELFKDKIYVVNHESWGPEYPMYVENYISTVTIGNYQGNGKDYTNLTSSPVTILGQVVQPGETVTVKNTMEIVDEATAPEGKLYVLNIFADAAAIYKTYNKGYRFEAAKFAGEAVQPIMIDPVDGRSEQIILPVKPKEVVVGMLLSDNYACVVTPQEGSPELGKPGDFTTPHRYMVTNTTRRPDGQPARERLYEIRIQFLP